MRIQRTGRGARLIQDDVVLSEILDRPGATHTLFDVLGVAVAVLAPGPRFCMLGFAGGGMVAPLRAAGYPHPIEAVDLSKKGAEVFFELSAGWCGEVNLHQDDAAGWLRRQRRDFDAIVEDISTPSPVGVIKPYDSFDVLPDLMRKRIGDSGVAIVNLLPLPGTAWAALEARVAHPFPRALVVHLEEYENRLLLLGAALPPAAAVSRSLRDRLRAIGSNQARKLNVRTLHRD